MIPKDFIDDVGVAHSPAGAKPRIVSLVPSITELLFSLDLAGAVVGRTTFCVHPAIGVAAVTKVGGTKTVNLEKIEQLKPTHVVVNVDENRKEDVDAIAAMGCSVVVTHPIEPEDNLKLYRLLGGLFHRDQRAEALCADFSRALADLRDAAATYIERRVLYLIWRDPWMTISENTYISRTLALARLRTAGGRADVRYPEITFDEGLMNDIDDILLSTEPFPFKQKHLDEVCALTESWQTPVRSIDAEMVSWYGVRAIQGLRYLRDFAANPGPDQSRKSAGPRK